MNGQGALADEAFDRLVAAEEQSFWFRSRNRLINWAIDRYFPDADSFLEVGCGNGYVLGGVAASHPEMRVAGCDLSARGLAHAARRTPRADLHQADARELPYRDEFDVAGAFDVIEHIEDDRHALRMLRRAVKAGGGVLITVPQHPWLWSGVDRASGHHRRYRRRELKAKLSEAGLSVLRVTSFVTLALPLMAASRALGSLSTQPFDAGRELTLADPIDRILEQTVDADAVLVARGVNLPIGGSLLAITRAESKR
jgi:SAM-dependent methyltransferase